MCRAGGAGNGIRQRWIMQRVAGAGEVKGATGETGDHLGVNLDQTAALEVVKCGPTLDLTCAWYVCIFPSSHLPAQF